MFLKRFHPEPRKRRMFWKWRDDSAIKSTFDFRHPHQEAQKQLKLLF